MLIKCFNTSLNLTNTELLKFSFLLKIKINLNYTKNQFNNNLSKEFFFDKFYLISKI